jgi:hypothetical protein
MLAAGTFCMPWFTQRAWGTYTQTTVADGTPIATIAVFGGSLDGLRVVLPAGVVQSA